jgi:hypothetical protein
VSSFDTAVHGRRIDYYFINQTFVLRRTTLASLDKVLGVSAWTFGESQVSHDASSLSIRIQDFDDLWGPIQVTPADTAPGFIRRLDTKHGSIRPLVSPFSTQLSANEFLCYWYPGGPGIESNIDTQTTSRDSSSPTDKLDSSKFVQINVLFPKDTKLLMSANLRGHNDYKISITSDTLPQISNLLISKKAEAGSLEQESQTPEHSHVQLDYAVNVEHESNNDMKGNEGIPTASALPITPGIAVTNSFSEAGPSGNESSESESEERDLKILKIEELNDFWLGVVKRRLVEKLILDHKSILMRIAGIITHGEGERVQQSGERALSAGTCGEGSNSSSQPRGRKRPRKNTISSTPDDDGDEDDDSRKSNPRSSVDRSGSPKPKRKRLACHFYVRSPQLYQDEQACTGPGFLSIKDLK